jgi:hypothetical protein
MCFLCGDNRCGGGCHTYCPDPNPCNPCEQPTKCFKYRCGCCGEKGTVRVPISCPAWVSVILNNRQVLQQGTSAILFGGIISGSQNNSYNTATGTYTVQWCHNGMYNITSHIGLINTSEIQLTVQVDIRVNGNTIILSNNIVIPAGTTFWEDLTTNYPLSSGQTVTVNVTTSGSGLVVDPSSVFSLVETVSLNGM